MRTPTHFRLVDAIRPNKNISSSVFVGIGIFWMAVLISSWVGMNSVILPSPLEVIRSFRPLWNDEGLGQQLMVSFTLNLQALGIMTLLSLVLAYLTVAPLFRPFAAIISAGRFNGFVGLPLIFLMIFHDAHWVKIWLLVFGMSVFTVPSIVKIIDLIPKEQFDHARTLRMGEWRVVWEVVILGQMDEVIEALRINAAMGWMLTPLVEGLFRYEGGIGTMMLTQEKHFQMAAVYCIAVMVSLVGLAQDCAIGIVKRILCPYAALGMERV